MFHLITCLLLRTLCSFAVCLLFTRDQAKFVCIPYWRKHFCIFVCVCELHKEMVSCRLGVGVEHGEDTVTIREFRGDY